MRQRSGVGSVLFSACEREASLNLVKATLGTVGFYKRFWFIEVGRGFDLKRGVQLPHDDERTLNASIPNDLL